MAKSNKYPNGYVPKIKYWASQLNNPKFTNTYILNKIDYFTTKEQIRLRRLELMEQRDGEEGLRYIGG